MKGAFTPPGNPAHRAYVHGQIQQVVQTGEDEVVEAAEAAVAGIRLLDRFGPAVATRFLALARPDRLVSVNGPSSAGLGAIEDRRGACRELSFSHRLAQYGAWRCR